MIPSIRDICDREYFGMKLGLSKIRKALRRLGNPEKKFPSIHIAGTNGKGSTAAMIANILETAGLKVGLFTSPHLHHVNERFKINGVAIPESSLMRLVKQIEAVDDPSNRLTFFEFMTALAFLYFHETNVDIAVVEVGLGGRLDATNVIKPQVSVITPIDYDHKGHLGNTLQEIALEKAGIMKRGIPVVCGHQIPRVRRVLREAAAKKTSPFYAVKKPKLSADGRFQLDGLSELWTPNLGSFQAANAALAVQAIQLLSPRLRVSRDAIRQGLASTYLAGRMEILHRHPLILLDVAHNPAAMKTLVESSRPLFSRRNVHCLFGAMKDKDVRGMMQALSSLKPRWHLTRPLPERAMSLSDLESLAASQGLHFETHGSVKEALDCLRSRLDPDHDALLVTGSLFLVSEARDILCSEREAA